jgi:hypothetical protein
MMRVTALSPAPEQAMVQPAPRGARERHRGPDDEHGNGSLTQHAGDQMQDHASR